MKKRIKDCSFFRRKISRLLCKSQCKDPNLTALAVKLLDPFCKIAASGQYRLAKDSPTLKRAAKTALTVTFGKPVKRVIFLSARKSTPRYFRGELGLDHLEDQLSDLFREQLRRGLNVSTEAILWYGLKDVFVPDLRRVFRRKSVKGAMGAVLVDTVGEVLAESFFSFLGFIVLGNKEEVKKLEPLIQLLAKAIPIAQKRGEPCTWFVLVR